MTPVTSPLQGTVVSVDVQEGDRVRTGQQLVVVESMKMEHVVSATVAGVVERIDVSVGDTVMQGDASRLLQDRHLLTASYMGTTEAEAAADPVQEG